MAATQMIAGIATLHVPNFGEISLRGNFTISHSLVERTMLAGQDGVHGYQELPRVPWMEADISTMPGFDVRQLDGMVDVDVQAALANGWNFVLTGAITKAGLEQNTRDGQMRVRWEGTGINATQGGGSQGRAAQLDGRPT
jgi:hypothetical protein